MNIQSILLHKHFPKNTGLVCIQSANSISIKIYVNQIKMITFKVHIAFVEVVFCLLIAPTFSAVQALQELQEVSKELERSVREVARAVKDVWKL